MPGVVVEAGAMEMSTGAGEDVEGEVKLGG